MSGWQELPSQQKVLEYDPRYISDVQLAYTIYRHQTNNSVDMQVFEQAIQKEELEKQNSESQTMFSSAQSAWAEFLSSINLKE